VEVAQERARPFDREQALDLETGGSDLGDELIRAVDRRGGG
jgi:hypothetical protein